jgi:hypothetical protein
VCCARSRQRFVTVLWGRPSCALWVGCAACVAFEDVHACAVCARMLGNWQACTCCRGTRMCFACGVSWCHAAQWEGLQLSCNSVECTLNSPTRL